MRLSGQVRYAEVDGLVVVLDLRDESYSVLDEVASAMWLALCEAGSVEAALPELERRYDGVDPERLRADADGFAADCVARGFMDQDGAGRERPEPPTALAPIRPRVGHAWRSLLATRRHLRRDGLERAYGACAQAPLAEPHAPEERLDAALKAFVSAENAFLSRRAPDDCLLRSLALYRFLRAAGLPVEHRIGVRRFPFGAHAWVEHDGRVLLDDETRTSGFTVLARLPAEE